MTINIEIHERRWVWTTLQRDQERQYLAAMRLVADGDAVLVLQRVDQRLAGGHAALQLGRDHAGRVVDDQQQVELALVGLDQRRRAAVAGDILGLDGIVARGGHVIAVVTEGDRLVRDKADHVIEVPETLPLLTPLLATIPMQLLAYQIAVRRGADVDQPRNLAKSVRVE